MPEQFWLKVIFFHIHIYIYIKFRLLKVFPSILTFWCVSNYHAIDIQVSPKDRPVSNLSTAKEASSFIKHAELCYCFWHHHIGQKNSFRLKKILSCFLHFLYFLMEHAVANKHFKQNFFFLIKSNSETQQNHEPEWTQPILSTALNSIPS